MINYIDDIDDIIFRNRNKEYGAYHMRKKYNKYLLVATILAVAFFVFAAVLPYIVFSKPEKQLKESPLFSEYLAPPPQENIKKPEDVNPIQMRKIQRMAKFVIPEVTAKIEEETNNFSTESKTGDSTSDGNSSTGSSQGSLYGGGGDPNAVYTYVEEAPSYPGGENARMQFLRNNIKYPKLALQNKIQGKVYISFIVEKNGSLSNIKVLQGIGAGCDEEALRVVNLMPKWKPGKTQGREVRVVITMPVNFVLQMSKT
ncbi:MAG TPA: TonB family protein [Bacteroidales bacterium]|nr:TonB family protein [Bacteroidales bacterium]